jgi:hypothetical protein
MQTFLPYADATATARCLDDQRLGKQRVEAMQVLSIINMMTWDPSVGSYVVSGKVSPYAHHPVVKMWRGHCGYLVFYTREICREWRRRGFLDSVESRLMSNFGWFLSSGTVPTPPWLGDPRLHASHRSILLAKDRFHYQQFGWKEEPAVRGSNERWPYFWPTEAREAS